MAEPLTPEELRGFLRAVEMTSAAATHLAEKARGATVPFDRDRYLAGAEALTALAQQFIVEAERV